MRRVLLATGLVLLAAIALPPIWFAIFPADPAPALPAPGTRVVLDSGVGLNVLDAGDGPAAVLVHGLPGSAYDWRETSDALVRLGMRAIAYDRVGYGRSDARPGNDYLPAANAAELLALLEAMDLRDVTVVGWSYGGLTAMTAAMAAPDRIARIVLVGTAGPDSAEASVPEPSSFMRLFYSDPVLRWRAAIPPLSVGLMRALSDQAFSGGPQPDWWLAGLRANFDRWDTLITFREEMLGLTPESASGFDIRRIEFPTLLLHGDDDRLAPVEIARYLGSQIDGAQVIIYPGASHMLPVTHANEISKEISGFAR